MRKLRLREVKALPHVTARKCLSWDLRPSDSEAHPLQLAGGGEGADSWLLIRSVLFSALALLHPNEQILHYAPLTLQKQPHEAACLQAQRVTFPGDR